MSNPPRAAPWPGQVPAPYDIQRAGITAWLDDHGPNRGRFDYRIAVLDLAGTPYRFDAPTQVDVGATMDMTILTLTYAGLAQAPAPYVGRPFAYRWRVATDDAGRTCTGSAGRQYLDGDHEYIPPAAEAATMTP